LWRRNNDTFMCENLHMFSLLILTNLSHWLHLAVIFSSLTGDGLICSLTLAFTYIYIVIFSFFILMTRLVFFKLNYILYLLYYNVVVFVSFPKYTSFFPFTFFLLSFIPNNLKII
jgi:hypothetical protein